MTDKNNDLLKLLKQKIEQAQESKPKAIVSFFIDAINAGTIKKSDRLPSINYTANFCKIACETVRRVYGELKQKGIVSANQGKAFFVVKSKYDKKVNVFLLFNFMSNPYKALLMRGIVEGVGNRANLNFFAYHNNAENFKNLVKENLGKYEYYVIIPERLPSATKCLSAIPQNKLCLLDFNVDFPLKDCAQIVQNFDKNLLKVLQTLAPELEKYKGFDFKYVRAPQNRYPIEIGVTLQKFAQSVGFNYSEIASVKEDDIKAKTLWFAVDDSDLVKIMLLAKQKNLKLCQDFGILTYNDTEMKHIVEGGVSTVSVDFYKMGRRVAEQILDWNPTLNLTVETQLVRGKTI